MPLSKAQYEQALKRPLTDDEYRKLTGDASAASPNQSRDASAYDGARLMEPADRTGFKAPIPKGAPTPIELKDKGSAAPVTYGSLAEVEDYAARTPDVYDEEDLAKARAEYGGGPIAGYKPPEPPAFKYSAPMTYDTGHKGELRLTGQESEADLGKWVEPGYAKEIKGELGKEKREEFAATPVGKLVVKTPPKPGLDYSPNVTSLPPSTFDEPPKPQTPPILAGKPAAPTMTAGVSSQPEPQPAGASFADVVAWHRKKWGL